MVSFIQRDHSFFSPETTHASLVATLLSGHDQASKKSAQHAVDILKKCKSTVHEFTDEIIDCGESLFLRKLVLGIPAQASGKNLTRPLMPSAPQTSCVRATSPRPS